MSSERDEGASLPGADVGRTKADADAGTGQAIEGEEKNLSRHTTKDSDPPLRGPGQTTGEDEAGDR